MREEIQGGPSAWYAQQIFEATVSRLPEAMALSFQGRRLTYAELNRRANRLAHYLRKMVAFPETPIAICLDRSPEMVVAVLAILKAGGCYVPMDPRHPAERLKFTLKDTNAPVVLTQRRLVEVLPPGSSRVVCLDGEWEQIERESERNPASNLQRDHAAAILYTSGSTGLPKGVVLTHGALAHGLWRAMCCLKLEPQDRMAALASLAFGFSFIELMTPWLVGAGSVLLTREEVLDWNTLADRVQDISVLHAVPSLLRQLLNVLTIGTGQAHCPSLRKVLTGGDTVPPALIQEIRRVLPESSIAILYGATELGILCMADELDPKDKDTKPSIGLPLPGIAFHLLSPDLTPAPIGSIGELFVGGRGLARGYLNRPDLTADRFVANPYSTERGSRLYRTGDLGRVREDGKIEFLGRVDYQLKIRGHRIEPAEIESVLEAHPDVNRAVVVGQEDSTGEKRLIAFFESDTHPLPRADQFRNHLTRTLPDYMVPSQFVWRDRLPVTPNGKIDRRQLPAQAEAVEACAITACGAQAGRVEPCSPREQGLRAIWSEVLTVTDIGVHDNFIDLGGHSILAAQCISRVRDMFDVDLPFDVFFEEDATIARMASLIDAIKGLDGEVH